MDDKTWGNFLKEILYYILVNANYKSRYLEIDKKYKTPATIRKPWQKFIHAYHYDVVIDCSQTQLDFCVYNYFNMEVDHKAFRVEHAGHN